jgi:hypothetical protein
MHGVLIEDAVHDAKFHIHSNTDVDGLRLAYLAPPPALVGRAVKSYVDATKLAASCLRISNLAVIGKTRQHHRRLELVHACLGEARGRGRQWLRIQRQARHVCRTTRWLERICLARAGVVAVEAPDGVAHLCQRGIERRRERPALLPDAKRACAIRQSGTCLPRMTNRLRGIFKNLE